MAGKHKGVQEEMKNMNKTFLFIPCGNHTLNLVGNDAGDACDESIKYFGMFQSLFNFFRSSPSRWEIFKRHSKDSIHSVSKTRWTAKFKSARPSCNNLDKIIAALIDVNRNLVLPPASIF